PRLSFKVSKASIAADAFPESTTTQLLGSKDQNKSITLSSSVSISDDFGSNNQVSSNSQPILNPVENIATNGVDPTVIPASIPATSTIAPFSAYFTVLPAFKTQVEQISATTKTSITIVSSQLHALPSTKSVVAAHARQEMVEVLIWGSWENAESARLLLLAAIDALQPGTVQEKIQVELKYQNMVGGRKREQLQELMAKTRTNIYLASPFVQTINKSGAPLDPKYGEIYITGEPSKVQMAKDALAKVYTRVQAAAPAFTRQVNIVSRKLDWMLVNHRDKLRSIMLDNASFIAFPPLGASHPVLFVYGESRVNVERTIRTVMQLASQFHSGSINMLAAVRDSLLITQNALSPIANISKLVSQASGAEVEFRNNSFLIFGSEIETRIAVQYLADVDFVKAMHSEIKFSVELANEHREFISGKKNGKINRIMKATGAKIKFDPCNDYNFYVDLSSTIAVKALEALALLQEELPAEISFYVPETYHKRIIGVGGKNIQRIMKKYGVYVKFSNSEEFANLGGYFDNLDNVVARTPSKNALNLENLKHAVMELVNPKDKDFVHHSVLIPKQHHLSLLSDHAKALRELQETFNATVRFPEKETGSDIVWVSGPESLIRQATSTLLSYVDEQYIYPVPFSEAMSRVLTKPEFKTDILEKMKNEWNMTLIPPTTKDVSATNKDEDGSAGEVDSTAAKSTLSPRKLITPSQQKLDNTSRGSDGDQDINENSKLARSLSSLTDSDDDDDDEDSDEEDHVFVFKYSRNNEDYLQDAKQLLVQFLIDNQIGVYDDEIRVQRPRSDSFAEAFPHFNSKILSSVAGGELPTSTPSFPNYSLFENVGNAFEAISLGPSSTSSGANSGGPGAGSMVTPDIRALFSNGPSQGLPPLASSPPRWPEQHSRQLTSVPGSSSGIASSTTSSGPAHSPNQTPVPHQTHGQPPSYNRLTSLPIDPWASPGKQQQQQQPSTAGYHGTIGQFRTPPPGMSITGGNGYYSPSSHGQLVFSPEGPYGGTMGFQAPVSNVANHLYSSNSSPVQGASSNLGNFDSQSPRQQQQQQQHHPLPQRPLSGSFVSRDNLQFLEDKMSIPAFGPGYGPALNSGSNRSQQQLMYQQQQQQTGQTYPSQHHFGQPVQYPQHRQRHSSHNSTTSHHTMFLGPIGGGLGSANGSVNSDDISTEDDSDEPFDDIRYKHRSHNFYSHGMHGGNTGFGQQTPPPSVLANRRGSVPSMGSMYSNQQIYHSESLHHSTMPLPNVVRLSNSSSDLYGRKSVVNTMSRPSMGQQGDGNIVGSNRMAGFGNGSSTLNMSGLSSGSVFGNTERDLFSSGLGGIIGGGTISQSGNSFNTHHTHTSSSLNNNIDASQQSPVNGHTSSGVSYDGHAEGRISSTLSPSALPFIADVPLDRSGQHHM
ncbi:hypothetical protein BX616_002237, partial [Lobosporangium transversale]